MFAEEYNVLQRLLLMDNVQLMGNKEEEAVLHKWWPMARVRFWKFKA